MQLYDPSCDNTTKLNVGRLEVCYNENWGSVCDDGNDMALQLVADVACRQLGHDESEM